jgi:deoxyadenosine/deoxycytidine kinase
VLYLHRPVPILLKQIKKRGRSFEQQMSSDYLENIQRAYFEFFKMEPEFPIVVVGLDDLDFENDPNLFEQLNNLLLQKYNIGVHFKNLTLNP